MDRVKMDLYALTQTERKDISASRTDWIIVVLFFIGFCTLAQM